jgi:broad specificity phosphatase PhoE
VRDARLRECDYGDLTGAPASRVAAERLRRVDEPFPGGESYRQVVERTRTFLRDVAADRPSARVLVIAHSANRWALEHLLDGVALEDAVAAPFAWQPGWEYRLPRGGPAG